MGVDEVKTLWDVVVFFFAVGEVTTVWSDPTWYRVRLVFLPDRAKSKKETVSFSQIWTADIERATRNLPESLLEISFEHLLLTSVSAQRLDLPA